MLPQENGGKPDLTPQRPNRRLPEAGWPADGNWRGRGPVFSTQASGPDLGSLLQALGRRWLLAATLGLLVAGAAALVTWYGLSPRYTVYGQIRVAAAQPALVFKTPEGRGDFATFQRTQAATLKSRFVLNAALKREEVKRLPLVQEQAEPLSWLEDELRVEFKEGSEILALSMTGTDPAPLTVIVNAVMDAYLREVTREESRNGSARAAELENILTETKNRLRDKRDRLKKKAEELGTANSEALTARQVTQLGNLGQYRQQLAQVQFELMRAQGKLAAHKARGKLLESQTMPEEEVQRLIAADPRVQEAATRVTRLQQFVADYEADAVRPTERTLVLARAKLATAQRELDQLRAELRKPVEEEFRKRLRAEFAATLAALEDETAILTSQEKSLFAQIESLSKDTTKVGNSTVELEMLKAEIEQEEKTTDKVAEELNALQVELRRPIPRISKYQEASVQKRDIRRQLLATGAAAVAALVVVCFAVGYWEYRARRIHSATEIVKGAGLRVLGALPDLPSPADLAANDEAMLTGSLEPIDAVRTLLLRDASIELTRLVMVTSAVEGEGKTSLAAHLASSLARAGRKTLLIDCDLRQPAAHQLFELPLQPGFSELLLGEVTVEEAIIATPVDGLWFLPAGQWDREVIQALARNGIEKLFEHFKEEFEFVVVDSHPVLSATDSLLIGQQVDVVLLSVQRDVSRVPRVYAAGQQLSNLGIRVLGVVVNGLNQADLYSPGYQFVPHPTR